MKIGIVRHFKVDYKPVKLMNSKGFEEYVTNYDEANVIYNETNINNKEWARGKSFMDKYGVISRAENISTFIQRDELKNIKPEDNISLPRKVLDYAGNINEISFPQQGMCSLVTVIQGDKGRFLLKTAKGLYRGKELYAEFLAMRALKDTKIPIPSVYDFFQEQGLYYLLREYSEGSPLNILFQNNKDKHQRLPMLIEMGKALSEIHAQYKDWVSYESFINAQIYFAEQHYKNNTIDPEDFVFEGHKEEPKAVLEWLKENKPHKGKVCLIHGDYRPKNILWHNHQISSIIDWAFCDMGDPYYDLAIFNDYFLDEDERQAFLKAYGIEEFDEKRLKYFCRMAPFINI